MHYTITALGQIGSIRSMKGALALSLYAKQMEMLLSSRFVRKGFL